MNTLKKVKKVSNIITCGLLRRLDSFNKHNTCTVNGDAAFGLKTSACFVSCKEMKHTRNNNAKIRYSPLGFCE